MSYLNIAQIHNGPKKYLLDQGVLTLWTRRHYKLFIPLRPHVRIWLPCSAALLWFFAAPMLQSAPSPPGIPVFQYDARADGWVTAKGFDMVAAVTRFSTDYGTLDTYYDAEWSRARSEAFVTFDRTWLKVLDEVPFDTLDVAGRIDWLLLRARLQHDLDVQEQTRERREEMKPLVPYIDVICGLDDQLRERKFISGAQAAAALAGISEQIKKLTADVETGKLKAPPTVGRRAARATESLRRSLGSWYHFYDGYDPEFTWWTAEPFKRVDAALKAYESVLQEHIAGIKPGDKDTIIGDPVGRDALVHELAGAVHRLHT